MQNARQTQHASSGKDRVRHVSHFIETADRFVKMAAVDDFMLVPYRDTQLPYFSKLPPENQKQILEQMNLMIELGIQLHSEKQSIRGSQYAWAFCKALGMVPPHDLYGRIPENTVIDIYDSNHKLIFACLDFFEIVSYSLEELYSRPWMDLFVRENTEVFEALWDLSNAMLEGKHDGPVDTSHLDSCIIRETAHPELRWARMKPRLFAPLFKHRKVSGYICANEIIEMSIDCIPAKRRLARET